MLDVSNQRNTTQKYTVNNELLLPVSKYTSNRDEYYRRTRSFVYRASCNVLVWLSCIVCIVCVFRVSLHRAPCFVYLVCMGSGNLHVSGGVIWFSGIYNSVLMLAYTNAKLYSSQNRKADINCFELLFNFCVEHLSCALVYIKDYVSDIPAIHEEMFHSVEYVTYYDSDPLKNVFSCPCLLIRIFRIKFIYLHYNF